MVSSGNKAAQSGGTLSEQLGLNTAAACDSFLLAFPEHCIWKPVTISAMIWRHQGLLESRLLALVIRTQMHLAVAYWEPFFLPLPAEDAQWQGRSQAGVSGAGTVLLSSTRAVHCAGSTVIAPGLQHCWVCIFEEAEVSKAVSASLNALQIHAHRSDSSASALMSVELLQLYRNEKEGPVKLTVFREFGLDLTRTGES